MSRSLAAVAAMLLLAAAASPVRAVRITDTPTGQGVVQLAPNEAALKPLYDKILQGVVGAANSIVYNVDAPVSASAAMPPPVNANSTQVAQAIAAVMSAAVEQAKSTGSLGNPSVFKYSSVIPGDKRVALFRLPKGRAKGTCIFIHGCKHDPYSWFYKSSKCPQCTGLPEEVSHSKQCLARGYAVLALMSKDRRYRYRCFSSSGKPELSDQADAATVIKAWTKKYKLWSRSKYMFGVSSGAAFAIKFPGTMWIDGVISEVNMPWPDKWGLVDKTTLKLLKPFPPTAYYMMQRDVQTERQIKKAVYILTKINKVPADYVYVPARPVGPNFLAQRSIYISPQNSKLIYQALRKINVLDANDMVRYDVRIKTGWTKKLYNAMPWLLNKNSPYFNLISDESQIWQELNLAWSWHEIVSDFVRPTLMWLESGGKKNLNDLVKRYDLGGRISCLTEKKEGCK